jgi:hypothetical protein
VNLPEPQLCDVLCEDSEDLPQCGTKTLNPAGLKAALHYLKWPFLKEDAASSSFSAQLVHDDPDMPLDLEADPDLGDHDDPLRKVFHGRCEPCLEKVALYFQDRTLWAL